MRQLIPGVLWTAACLCWASCDQSTVHFPEDSSVAGACGTWYAGGGDSESIPSYAIEEGAVFPCLVWESVRKDDEDTWLNVGDLYLGAKHGEVSAKALVIVKVGVTCAGCHDLIVELSNSRDELSPVAVMVALTHGDAVYPDIYPLDDAEEIIVDEEGWPGGWYLTNDTENHFSESEFVGIPWVTVVHLETMEVVSSSNQVFSAANVSDLIELVEGL